MPGERVLKEVIDMNYDHIFRDLVAERDRLQRVIEKLEELAQAPLAASTKRRGRPSMGAKERLEVSERMKRYWANRRRASGK